jgi:AraC-like DNA-binding protein
MPGSFTSVFGEPDDYRAALQADGVATLLPTREGQFRARLIRVSLHRARLAAGEEAVARIAFFAVPAGMVLFAFAIGGRPSPIWGRASVATGEIVAAGPGERLHALTIGPSRWGTIHISEADLVAYGRSLTGTAFAVPNGICKWRPPSSAARQLLDLHRAAVRIAESRSAALAGDEAAHGLEQQLIHALVKCLSAGPVDRETPAARRHRDILARFEDLIEAASPQRMTDICAALGVSERLLRACCKAHLRMSQSEYRRRRALQRVYCALCNGDAGASMVSEVAGRNGFHDLGRFAGSYRKVYGELPSATLRRSAGGIARPDQGRPRVKF